MRNKKAIVVEQIPTMQQAMESREERIARAAYLRAEARGFYNGDPMADWLAAEREIDDADRVQSQASVDATETKSRQQEPTDPKR